METLEKAKLVLRKYILENKEKVISDLNNMRKMSEGNDIFSYVENLSNLKIEINDLGKTE